MKYRAIVKEPVNCKAIQTFANTRREVERWAEAAVEQDDKLVIAIEESKWTELATITKETVECHKQLATS